MIPPCREIHRLHWLLNLCVVEPPTKKLFACLWDNKFSLSIFSSTGQPWSLESFVSWGLETLPFLCMLFSSRVKSKVRWYECVALKLNVIRIILKNVDGLAQPPADTTNQLALSCGEQPCQEQPFRMRHWLIPVGHLFINKSAEC
jgi:hypothetical protein